MRTSVHLLPVIVFVVGISHPGDELIALLRAASAERVRDRWDIPGINLVEDRGEDLPGLQQFVAADERSLLAPEYLEHQACVGIRTVATRTRERRGERQESLVE